MTVWALIIDDIDLYIIGNGKIGIITMLRSMIEETKKSEIDEPIQRIDALNRLLFLIDLINSKHWTHGKYVWREGEQRKDEDFWRLLQGRLVFNLPKVVLIIQEIMS